MARYGWLHNYTYNTSTPEIVAMDDTLYEENENRHEAICYAYKWAYGYNTDYNKYGYPRDDDERKNKDCTNYVSQCLSEGGIAKNGVWNPNVGICKGEEGAPWYDASAFYEYFTANGRGWTVEDPYTALRVGDVIQCKNAKNGIHHTMIIMSIVKEKYTDDEIKYSTPADIYICAHSTNRIAESFKEYQYYSEGEEFIYLHIVYPGD